MRRDGSSRQTQCVDMDEEETKVKKNLSRLIHTVQHLPSSRYRRGASSLWKLVDELESFQPMDSSRSVNPCQKTARKSFSRKYLDLRLYPARDRSSSPECILKNQIPENKPQAINSNNCKKNKKSNIIKKKDNDTNFELTTNISKDVRHQNKTKYDGNRNYKENVSPENYDDNICSSVAKNKSDVKGIHSKSQPGKLQNFQLRKKPDVKDMPNLNYSSKQFLKGKFDVCSNQETSLIPSKKRCKFKVMDTSKGLKNVGYVKGKHSSSNQFNNTLDKAFYKETTFDSHQASMVKKLTSYWNNLLNKDVEDIELSSSFESNDDLLFNNNFQDLARSTYKNTKDKKRRVNTTRHKSESYIDILKTLEGFSTNSDEFKDKKENKVKFIECLNEILSNGDFSNIKHEQFLHSPTRKEVSPRGEKDVPPTKPVLLEMGFDKSCGDNRNLQLFNKMVNVEPHFDFKMNHAIEVMDKIARKLKRFSQLSLTSDQVPLSHSLRTMLCLLTATVLSSEEPLLFDYVEPDVDEASPHGNEDIASKVDLHLSSKNVELSDISLTNSLNHINEHKKIGINDNLQLVPVQDITLRKVEAALRYLTCCKDFLWTEYLTRPIFYGDGLFNRERNRHSPRSFTFFIEEEISLEDDGFEKECCYFEDEEDESTEGEVKKSVFDLLSIVLERLVDLTADIILQHWPDSVQDFVNAVYQTLVSLLVWWVIMKEIFWK